jgi:hypothetical protein
MRERILLILILATGICCFAQESVNTLLASDTKLKTNIFFAIDEGQAIEGVLDMAQPPPQSSAPYTTVNRLWQQHLLMYLTAQLDIKERLKFILSIECDLHFSTVQPQIFPNTTRPGFFFYPNDVEIRYSLGNIDFPWLEFAIGYFPIKYNPDAKNLGEYLFRSGVYPNYIVSNFEFAMTRELGLRIGGNLGKSEIDRFKWDLFLTSETREYPLMDGTISAVISNNLLNLIDVGAGISFQRLFPVDESKTTPKDKPLAQYFNENGEQQYYTYSGTKVMGRATINPLRFVPKFKLPLPEVFGENPFFGENDLKIYGEAAILGTKDYVAYDSFEVDTEWINGIIPIEIKKPGTGKPVADSLNYYNNWKDRVPVMLGINLPTNPIISYGILPFILTKWLKDETGSDITMLSWITLIPALASGIIEHFLGWNMRLDVMTMEFEWFSQRFPNSNFYAISPSNEHKSPVPYPNTYRNQANFGKPEPVKYSFYFKKTFMERFAISGLIGRDHFRPISFVSPPYKQNDDFLQSKKHWWWNIRLSANF